MEQVYKTTKNSNPHTKHTVSEPLVNSSQYQTNLKAFVSSLVYYSFISTMENNELDSMTKTRLQDRLRAMGEKTTGNKPELIQRLLDSMQNSSVRSRNNRGDNHDKEEEEEQTGDEKTEEEEKQEKEAEEEEEEEDNNQIPFQRSAEEDDNSSDGEYVS